MSDRRKAHIGVRRLRNVAEVLSTIPALWIDEDFTADERDTALFEILRAMRFLMLLSEGYKRRGTMTERGRQETLLMLEDAPGIKRKPASTIAPKLK